jgi:hypothetical protein
MTAFLRHRSVGCLVQHAAQIFIAFQGGKRGAEPQQSRVLKIKLAKKAEAKSKQIKVNVGSEKTFDAKVQGKAA